MTLHSYVNLKENENLMEEIENSLYVCFYGEQELQLTSAKVYDVRAICA
jgi:hypothetical protein